MGNVSSQFQKPHNIIKRFDERKRRRRKENGGGRGDAMVVVMMMMMRAGVVSRRPGCAGAPKAHHPRFGGGASNVVVVPKGRRQSRWSSSNNNGTTNVRRWRNATTTRRRRAFGQKEHRGTRRAALRGTLFANEEEEEGDKNTDDDTDDDDDDDDETTDVVRAAASLQFGSAAAAAAAAAASGKDDDVNDDEKSKKRRKGGVAPGLYVVSTPIGNLEDITIRGLKILTEASLLLCEDTRKTRHLLTLLGVQSRGKRFLAYHSHNFYEQREQLRDRILENKDEEVIALVSDAGAPGVSDPGQDLVDLVLEATSTSGGGGDASVNNVVVPIPGASAVTTAVIGSGFKCDDGYKFCGFLPSKKNERIHFLESLTSERSLLVFFVSPHKLVKTLEDVAKVYSSPPRRVCVARELTKRHEEFFRGTCEECLEEFSKEGRARGEVTLLIESNAGASKNAKNTTVAAEDVNTLLLEKSLRHLLLERTENPLSVSEAARKVSQDLGVKRRVAYSMAQKIKDSHHHHHHHSSSASDSN